MQIAVLEGGMLCFQSRPEQQEKTAQARRPWEIDKGVCGNDDFTGFRQEGQALRGRGGSSLIPEPSLQSSLDYLIPILDRETRLSSSL